MALSMATAVVVASVLLISPGAAAAVDVAAVNRGFEALGGHAGSLWPNPRSIAYTIDSSLSASDSRIAFALRHWQERTCIRFVRRTREREYLRFVAHASSCSSYVGMRRGGNTINLARGCDRGAVVHEIGHALGLTHEQSRTDRDNYVTVDYSQIQSRTRNNFDKSARVNVGEYDYGSIMHYSSRAFATGRQPTIRAPERIGQRSGLSSGDVATIDFLYQGCLAPSQITRPRCLATLRSGVVHTVTASRPVEVSFAGRFTSALSAVAYSNGARLGARGSGGSISTITARVTPQAGQDTTVQATFTGQGGASVTCTVTLRGSGGSARPQPQPQPQPQPRPQPQPQPQPQPAPGPQGGCGSVCGFSGGRCYSCRALITYYGQRGYSKAAVAQRWPRECGRC